MSTGIDLDSVRHHVDIIRQVKAEQARLTEIEKASRAAIEGAMDQHEVGILDDDIVITWKTTKRNALNQQFLREQYPEVFELCKDTSVTRTFKVVV